MPEHICGNPSFDLLVCRGCHPEAPPIGRGTPASAKTINEVRVVVLPPDKPKSIGLLKRTWFWLKFGESYHRHKFEQSGSAYFCQVGHCSAWYGEQNWSSSCG